MESDRSLPAAAAGDNVRAQQELLSCCANCQRLFNNEEERITELIGKYPPKYYGKSVRVSQNDDNKGCNGENRNGDNPVSEPRAPSRNDEQHQELLLLISDNEADQMNLESGGLNPDMIKTEATTTTTAIVFVTASGSGFEGHHGLQTRQYQNESLLLGDGGGGNGNQDESTALFLTMSGNEADEEKVDGFRVTILEAMSIIFGFPLVGGESTLPFRKDDSCALCPDCGHWMTTLYQAFQELQNFADETAYISKGLNNLHETIAKAFSVDNDTYYSGRGKKRTSSTKERNNLKTQAPVQLAAATRLEKSLSASTNAVGVANNVLLSPTTSTSLDLQDDYSPSPTPEGSTEVITESGQKIRTSARNRKIKKPTDLGEIISPVRGSNLTKINLGTTSTSDKTELHDLGALLLESCGDNYYTESDLKTQPDGKFKCPDANCLKAFKNLKMLNRHALLHDLERTYSCLKCGIDFKNKQAIKEHILRGHQPGSEEQVSRKLRNRNDVAPTPTISTRPQKQKKLSQIRKKYSKLKNGKLKCDHCDAEFLNKRGFKKHLASHRKDSVPSRCTSCDQTFPSIPALTHHINDVHEKKVGDIHCPECGSPHSDYNELEAHFESVHKESLNQCFLCPKSFYSLSYLELHRQTVHKSEFSEGGTNQPEVILSDISMNHDGDDESEPGERKQDGLMITSSHSLANSSSSKKTGPFKCNKCGKVFKHKKPYNVHILFHNEAEPQFGCSQCPKRFFQAKGLKTHMLVHTSDNPQVCKDCDRVFTRPDHLRRHREVIHSQDRDKKPKRIYKKGNKMSEHQCKECDKTFTRKEYLRLHMRLHTGEKPYMCQDCGKSFRDPRNLAQHLVTHKTERPFCCSVCGLTFKRAHHLNDHEGTHRDDVARPFVCTLPFCKKAFKLRKHLISHELVHTGSRDHSCSVCGKAFNRKDNLRQHINKVHGKELEHVQIPPPPQRGGESRAQIKPLAKTSGVPIVVSTAAGGAVGTQLTEVLQIIPVTGLTTLPSSSIIQATLAPNAITHFTYTHL